MSLKLTSLIESVTLDKIDSSDIQKERSKRLIDNVVSAVRDRYE